MVCRQVCRLLSLQFGLVLSATLLPSSTSAQRPTDHLSVSADLSNVRLAFSRDGRVLRIIGEKGDTSETQHVRAIAYNAATGVILHTIDLPSATTVLSITSDGGAAIINRMITGSEDHSQLVVLDTDTGKTQPLPAAWYDPKDPSPEAELSADGRLISIYSESGPADRPMTVTVYTWLGQTLVARQLSEFVAAGGAFGGGVTTDGHAIEFESNRVGRKVVSLKTGREMARFGPDSVRSPGGEWVVEMPNITFLPESAPRKVLIKDGANGRLLGSISVPVSDDVAYGQMTGAFCGTGKRFILAAGHSVAAYDIPSGALLANFPADTWRDPSGPDHNRESAACSPAGTRVAILSGTRLTIHTIKR